jgi:hypothetical protein
MITSLEVTNFQGFQGTQKVSLAPITLIFGPNASGKSSIGRALKLSLNSLAANRNKPAKGFLVNTWHLADHASPLTNVRPLIYAPEAQDFEPKFGVKLGFSSTEKNPHFLEFFLELTLADHVLPYLNGYKLPDFEGMASFKFEGSDDELHIENALSHSDLVLDATDVIKTLSSRIGEKYAGLAEESKSEIQFFQLTIEELTAYRSSVPKVYKNFAVTSKDERLSLILDYFMEATSFFMQCAVFLEKGDDSPLDADLSAGEYENALKNIFSYRSTFKDFVSQISYPGLPAIEDDPNIAGHHLEHFEFIDFSDTIRARKMFKKLATALDAAKKLVDSPVLNHIFVGPLRPVLPRLQIGQENLSHRNTDSVREWITSLTEGRYDYNFKMLSVHDEENCRSWDVDEALSRKEVLDDPNFGVFSSGSQIALHEIVDTYTGASLPMDQVGVGLSQLIPVIDAAFSTAKFEGLDLVQRILEKAKSGPLNEDDLSLESSFIYIEQPELHLHPKLQSLVANMLVDAHKKTGNQIVIETHSESILLRIQKLIRNGEIPKNLVEIIYVDSMETEEQLPDIDNESSDSDAPGSEQRRLRQAEIQRVARFNHMRNITMDDSGDILDPWPRTFADLRVQDLLG